MRLLPKRDHPGIRLRVSTKDGVVLELDSDELYLAARFAGSNGWRALIPGGPDGAGEFSTVPVKIEIKPEKLDSRA